MEVALAWWPYLAIVVDVLVAADVSGHAVIYKRDVRAAIGWVGLIWLAPVVGSLLYVTLGINRIRRRASHLRSGQPHPGAPPATAICDDERLDRVLNPRFAHLHPLANLIGDLTGRPLFYGNSIRPLVNGDEAYPEMLRAIETASESVTLSTYIFDNDPAGHRFVEALAGAVKRGAAVRVLVDDIGSRYTWPSTVRLLRRAGVPVARFMPTLLPARFRYANLRNHRKILVVDGRFGFTGGINIREGSWLGHGPDSPVQDLHFRVEGPVVAHLQETFADDWAFCTEELLQGRPWFSPAHAVGETLARGVTDGPDHNFERIRLTILGALSCARTSVRIVTPYFLPDQGLITALNMAAMRGVDVQIILPEKNNLALVQWASTALLWQVLERGCRVWLSPPPFDHSKLMIVDGIWSFIGSANWDPRSLRLNFEFNVECYDAALAAHLGVSVLEKMEHARPVTLADVDGRSLPVRLRDGVARLFTPYL